MQTNFSSRQLSDPATAASESVIRKCVHCGFCTATCPTYVLLGDELDSPRGRIYLMKDMLENERTPTAEVIRHVDRCLSCLACMTTCPSDVNYMHLVDHARSYIEQRYRRPPAQRFFRSVLATVLPHQGRFRAALWVARIGRPIAPLLNRIPLLQPIAAMLALAPRRADSTAPRQALPSKTRSASAELAPAARRGRVLLLQGCAEPVLQPQVRAATLRILDRIGYEVVLARDEGCCGALVHHLGREAGALAAARRNIDAWENELTRGLDAIVITASGCGTMIKDYGFLLRNDPHYADKAARASGLAKDVTELLEITGLPAPANKSPLTVAYHSACSMQHGQKISSGPQKLLTKAGFNVRVPNEAHLCCGSAGTYNMLQPQIAAQLGQRKVQHIDQLGAQLIATGNVGCAMQLRQFTALPVVHTVELLDWATGGPKPAAIV